jgi:propionate CoA-transferase
MQKFVPDVDEVSFSGRMATERGQRVRYITERAVFELIDGVVTLIEVAEGLDPRKDVVDHMGFEPAIAGPIAVMDRRIYARGTMGIASGFGSDS